jgi:hypothetical protein
MQPPRPHRRRRAAVAVLVTAALGGGAVAATSALSDDDPAPVAVAVLEPATVERSDLTASERLSGTVEQTESLTVVHREDDGTSVPGDDATPESDGATDATTGGAVPQGFAPAAARTESLVIDPAVASGVAEIALASAAVDDCPTTTTAVDPSAPTTTTTTTMPDGTTTTTAPCGTDGTGCATAPTTTTTTTVPDGPEASSTTTEPDTTSTTSCPTATTTTTTTAPPVSDPTTDSGMGGGTDVPVGGRTPSIGGTGSASGSAGGTTATTVAPTSTLTSVAALGSSIDLGDVMYTADGEPVVALQGALPAWRTLSTDVDDGADVRQLEESLVALGFDADGELVVDEEYDDATEAAVVAWQTALGVEATGEVVLGHVVFLAGPTTVSAVDAVVGDEVGDGDAVLTLAATTQQIVVEVPDALQDVVAQGTTVELSSGGTTGVGTVTALRSANGDSGVVVEAVVSPAEPLVDVLDGASIDVTVAIGGSTGVLVVPSEALVSRLDGSYALEVVAADGTTTWVPVEVVTTSGNRVGVVGDGIEAGTTVLVPA